MFCKNCGKQCADTDNVCSQCGTRLKAAPVMPVAPVAPVAPAVPKTTNVLGFDLSPYVRYITLGVTALALIFSIVNLLGLYDVNITISLWGMSEDQSIPVSDLYESSSMLFGINIMYGMILLVAAGVAALYSLKELIGLPYYDQFIGKLPFGNMPLALTGAAAAVGGILQFVLYSTVDINYYGIDTSVSVNWTTWVMIVLGVALVAVDLLVLNNMLNNMLNKKRAE